MTSLRDYTDEQIEEQAKKFKALPTFEFFLAIVFLGFAVILIWFPSMFNDSGDTYKIFNRLSHQWLWAVVFFATGALNTIALLRNNTKIRYAGLVVAGSVFLVFFLNFLPGFPNLSTWIYPALFMSCVVAVAEVKRSGL